jgi:hypothetical protein
MVKIEMYKAFDGKIFENREDCVAYEQENIETRYEKLKNCKSALDDYCSVAGECEDCAFFANCGNFYQAIKDELQRLEGE